MSKALRKKITNTESHPTPRSMKSSSSALAGEASVRSVVGAKRAPSFAERAYEALKHQIITCVLRPGEYLNESQLCERLGIGRTPVHQAIGQLHQERFLDLIPRKGVIVRPISLDEYFNLDEARLLLEVGAIRLAAQRITPQEISELEAIHGQDVAARRAGNIEQLLLSDRDFHFVLADSTRNPVLAGMLKAAYERSLRVWFVSSRNLSISSSNDEHERILDALRRRDSAAAAEVMREHVLSSRLHTMQPA